MSNAYLVTDGWRAASGDVICESDYPEAFETAADAIEMLARYDLKREYRTEVMCGGDCRRKGMTLFAEVTEWELDEDGEPDVYVGVVEHIQYGPYDYDRDFD